MDFQKTQRLSNFFLFFYGYTALQLRKQELNKFYCDDIFESYELIVGGQNQLEKIVYTIVRFHSTIFTHEQMFNK